MELDEFHAFCELHDSGINYGIAAMRCFDDEPIPMPEEIERAEAETVQRERDCDYYEELANRRSEEPN